jgi:peptidyl-prolyl cis-trans isomerase C
MNEWKSDMKQPRWMWFGILLSGVLIGSCGPKEPPSETIAKVGDTQLTLADIQDVLPEKSSVQYSRVQVEQYVQRWVERQLIYQELKRRNFDDREDIQRELERVKRDYLVASFLEHEIDQYLDISDEEINDYYSEKSSEYIRPTDHYHVQLILTETYREASRLRREILKGLDFAMAAREHSVDASNKEDGDLGWVSLETLSPELAQKIPSLGIDRLSGPIKTEVGYALVKVIDKRKKGEVQSLDEVRDIVLWRLKAQKRELRHRRLVSNLKEEVDIEMNTAPLEDLIAEPQRPSQD